MIIKHGTTLILEHGEMSDYSFDGPFQVIKEFDQATVCDEFRVQWKPLGGWEDYPSEQEFIAWLCAQGYIEPIESHRWPIGSWRFDPEIQKEIV